MNWSHQTFYSLAKNISHDRLIFYELFCPTLPRQKRNSCFPNHQTSHRTMAPSLMKDFFRNLRNDVGSEELVIMRDDHVLPLIRKTPQHTQSLPAKLEQLPAIPQRKKSVKPSQVRTRETRGGELSYTQSKHGEKCQSREMYPLEERFGESSPTNSKGSNCDKVVSEEETKTELPKTSTKNGRWKRFFDAAPRRPTRPRTNKSKKSIHEVLEECDSDHLMIWPGAPNHPKLKSDRWSARPTGSQRFNSSVLLVR